jgi:hypothetical protein
VRAERLRSLYFGYLSDPPPVDGRAHEAAVHQLEEQVAEIRFGPVK